MTFVSSFRDRRIHVFICGGYEFLCEVCEITGVSGIFHYCNCFYSEK